MHTGVEDAHTDGYGNDSVRCTDKDYHHNLRADNEGLVGRLKVVGNPN
jgi:hypothetical protein